MQAFHIHQQTGRLLVNKQALLLNGIFSDDNSYRKAKSQGRLNDVKETDGRWVFVDSLTEVTQAKVKDTFRKIAGEYASMLDGMSMAGFDCTTTAVEFTAESLQINEPFIRSSIEIYLNSHYSAYTWAYLDAGLHSASVKGYSKQCALLQWMFDFSKKIITGEGDSTRCEVLMRSFRMNLLTALRSIELEVKIPRSEARFNKWFDDVMRLLEKGYRPEDIVSVKRQNNTNAGKVTDEQLKIAQHFYKNGTNMSVATVYRKWLAFGEISKWWMDAQGNFNPPTEGRLYQLLQPVKNAHYLDKTDAIEYRKKMIANVSRNLPEKKNHV